MPVVVEVALLAGRYHAHVWGEAQFAMAGPEWPPSPWRLLRALASVGYETRPAPSTGTERDDLIEKLGRCCAPEMWLPATAFREVRYYQPLKQKEDRALHHDFFAVPEGGRFYFVFDVELSEEEKRLLNVLLGRLRYLGRAESRAVLRLRNDVTGPPRGFFRVLPNDRAAGIGAWTPRRVLCPSADRDFRASDLWMSRQAGSPKRTKRPKAAPAAAGVPMHLVDALLSDRKPLPDGTRWIEYAQPEGSVVQELRCSRRSRTTSEKRAKVNTVVFRLCRRIPIPIGDLVAVARAYRDAVVRCFEAVTRGSHSCTLTGREEDGSVARGHRHVYYLPQPEIGGLEIATLVVRVPSGVLLSQEELDALLTVERIQLHVDDRYPITLVPEKVNEGAVVPSRYWKSLTPFLPPHGHRAGRPATLPELQLASCIEKCCGFTPLSATAVSGPGGTGIRTPVRTHEYGVAMQGSLGAATWRFTRRLAHWFTVEFTTPIMLSTPLGTDAHFGLGQFAPIPDTR